MRVHLIDRIFALILEKLIGKYHPIVAFFVFVLIYFIFVFFARGFDQRELLMKELREMSWLQRLSLATKTFVGIYIAYFVFYRLMIMTAMLDYPLPNSIKIFGEFSVKFLESVGLLK